MGCPVGRHSVTALLLLLLLLILLLPLSILGWLCHMRRHLSLSLLFGASDLDFESGCSDMARFLSKLSNSCQLISSINNARFIHYNPTQKKKKRKEKKRKKKTGRKKNGN